MPGTLDEITSPGATSVSNPRPKTITLTIPRLVQISGEVKGEVGRVLKLDRPQSVLGRSSDAALVVNDGGVSRQHAAIERHGEEYRLIDYGSRNGSYVNEQRVTTMVLRDGDLIQLGNATVLRFVTAPASEWLPYALEAGFAGWEYSLERREIAWSEHVDRVLRLPDGTLSGARAKLPSLFSPQDVERLQAAVTVAVNGSEPFEQEVRLHAGPAQRWVRLKAQVLRDSDGTPDRLSGTVADLSDQKRRELDLSRMAAMFECLSDAVFFTDDALSVADLNSAACSMFQLSRDAALGAGLFTLIGAPAAGALESAAREQVKEHGRWSIELQTQRDGREQSFEVVAFPLRGDDGVVGSAFLFREVTERKRLHAQLAFFDRLSSLGTLSAGIAHEINNPLTFVLSSLEYVSLSLTEPVDSAPALSPKELLDEQLAALKDALDGAHRIAGIVRDLKAFSRDDLSPKPVPTPVRRALELAVKMTQKTISTRARLETRFDDDVPLARATETRLAQVFTNLLINAAQATPEGRFEKSTITVRLYRDGDEVVTDVTDEGVGIPPEVLPRIFDPFFTTKPVGQGTGLGLSICHGLVRGFGGTMTVKSEPGKGSTFSVRLQAVQEPKAPSPSAPRGRWRSCARVLVVDDEPQILSSFTRALSHHEVVTCSTVDQAIATLAEREFDVILCDITMPVRSGMDLYDEVQKRRPELSSRVVFVTGGAFTPKANEFLSSVPNRVLAKPVDGAELSRVVQELLGPRPGAP